MLLQIFILLSAFGRLAFADSLQPLAKAASLFKGGHPELQDVLDYIGPGARTRFAGSFAIVLYTIAQKPEIIEKWFKDKGDEFYDIILYDLCDHSPRRKQVRFASEDSTGQSVPNVLDLNGGSDVESVKDRWWIAAVYTALKTEWETYYPKSEEHEILTQNATKKAEDYDNGMSSFDGWNEKEFPSRSIDRTAAHWMLTSLLRRNFEISIYSTDNKYRAVNSTKAMAIADHPYSIWIGPTKSGDKDEAKYSPWAMSLPETVKEDNKDKKPSERPVGHIALDRPGREKAEIDLGAAENSFNQAELLHLWDMDEPFDPETWYENEDLVSFQHQLHPPLPAPKPESSGAAVPESSSAVNDGTDGPLTL